MDILLYPTDNEIKEILNSHSARSAFDDRKLLQSDFVLWNGMQTRLCILQDGECTVEEVQIYIWSKDEDAVEQMKTWIEEKEQKLKAK